MVIIWGKAGVGAYAKTRLARAERRAAKAEIAGRRGRRNLAGFRSEVGRKAT